MGGTLVFMFLLDYFPDNAQNETSITLYGTQSEHPEPQSCDSSITDPILQIISRELGVILMPKWRFFEGNRTRQTSYMTKSRSENNLYYNDKSHEVNVNTIGLDNSLESASFESQKVDDLEYLLDGPVEQNLLEGSGKIENLKQKISQHVVAIFESLSNVTAQTCGGTLLAPRWVLTAASCVNLLGNLFANSTNSTDESVYTIIVNATDPLTDGTAHNVTEIHLHPQPDTTPLDLVFRNNNGTALDMLNYLEASLRPDLALMKIYPPASRVEEVKIQDVAAGMHVNVYGWAVTKNATTRDVMRAASFRARMLSPLECTAYYNLTQPSRELCLSASPDSAQLVSQMSWGGPVTRGGALVAVARADGLAPLAAWPLSKHAFWIESLIHDAVDE